jgi:proprotein convertase subtilisin/kexin type 5
MKESGKCLDKCDAGWTSNGKPDKKCEKCDASCDTCEDSDKKECKKCNPAYTMRVEGTKRCVKSCSRGLFNKSKGVCGKCDASCSTCKKSPKKCTSCFADDEIELYKGKCILKCPKGQSFIRDKCEPCTTCGTCPPYSSVKCLSCDDVSPFLVNRRCYKYCP